MKTKLVTTVLSMLDLDKQESIMSLLEQHKQDIMDTFNFKNVVIHPPNENLNPKMIAIALQPKSETDWADYNANHRANIKTWFVENLITPGLVKVEHTWISEIELVIQ